MFNSFFKGVIAVNAGSQNAGTPITLTDKEGNIILTRTPELPFAVVILSCPEIIIGETYMLTIGQNTGDFQAK